MKKTSRSMVNGSAIALVLIAIILLILLLLRRCGTNDSEQTETTITPVENISAGADTISFKEESSRTVKNRSQRQSRSRSRKSAERQPKVYPERSPLDEPVSR
ncbi:MAG: hypothetical protein K2I52_02170 [Muribaculaceae bacterium]|nr:hypothetical protein [Muribaculaceae bacterium]